MQTTFGLFHYALDHSNASIVILHSYYIQCYKMESVLEIINTNDFTSCAKIQLMFQFQICHCCPSRFISFLKFIFYVLFYCVFKVSWFFCKFFSSSLYVSYFFVPLPSSQKLPQLFYKITLCVLFNYSITFILKAILIFLLSIFKLVLCILFCCFITFV